MKELYKNPVLYYVLVPVLVALWPLLIWSVYLPKAEEDGIKQEKQYEKAEMVMEQILTLDPERLEYANKKSGDIKFDYTTEIDRIADQCKISEDNYTFSSKPVRTSKGQKSQSATLDLENIDIVKFADFLSKIQLRWASLQCEDVKITKTKGLKDTWRVNLRFTYYY